MTGTRRLAAIMAVDGVGYSRRSSSVSSGASSKRRRDGLLLEFPSVVAAFECDRHPEAEAERNAGTPEAKRILYRIDVTSETS
jgi:hypothetical protein